MGAEIKPPENLTKENRQMADNENPEEFDESTEDPEALAGFGEGVGDGEGKEQESEEKEEEKSSEEESGSEEGKEAEGEEKEGGEKEEKSEEEEKEETAADRAAKRAEKYKEKEGEQEQEEEKIEEEGKETGKSSPYTKEQIKDYLGIISDEDLPDEIVIGNDTVNLKALKEDYPEDFSSIKVLAGITASKIAQKMIDDGGYVKAADIQETMQGFQNEIIRLRFLDTVRDAHPDVNTVRKSPEFKAWVEAQPKHMQRLANSWDADDAIAILDAYKESEAKKAAEKHDKGLKDKKEKKDGLMSDGVRKKTSAPKTGDDDDKNDFEGGFNDAISGKN